MAIVLLFTLGCQATYYKIWEKLGKEKRDLLLSDVNAVKTQQQETAEHFKDALTRLQEAYGKKNTKLQAMYDRIKSDDERAHSEAEALNKRVERMNTTARDLFREWESELNTFTNREFKAKSKANLQRARKSFEALSQSLDKSTARMKPLLSRLHETTLFLKHNLNAQSLGAMKNESKAIEQNLDALLKQMNASIQEADEFLSVLKEEE